jgi:tetratricopeptide (TPR) repeat protein
MRLSKLVFGAIAITCMALPLTAAAESAAVKCNSKNPTEILEGCTEIINAGQEAPEHLAMAYTFRGAVYADQQMYDKAIADYTQAIRLAPTDPIAYFDRGVAFAMVTKLDASINDFTQAITLKPDYARAYLDRGRVYEMKGDKQSAQADEAKARSLEMH